MMIDPAFFWVLGSAFTLGLVSSVHCVGMCGGIMGALTMAIPKEASARRISFILTYNIGRITSYAVMGGLLGVVLSQIPEMSSGLRVIAGLLLIAMGLYVANWWQGLTYLEQGGRYLWAYLQPLSKPLLPVDRLYKSLLLGVVWGWLPCGLVYSALAYAATEQHALQSALVMAAFGVGTLPAVFATGIAAEQLRKILQKNALRQILAAAIMVFGVWTIWAVTGSHEHHDNGAHHAMPHDVDTNQTHADHSKHEGHSKHDGHSQPMPLESSTGEQQSSAQSHLHH